jgi:hypothetical protein
MTKATIAATLTKAEVNAVNKLIKDGLSAVTAAESAFVSAASAASKIVALIGDSESIEDEAAFNARWALIRAVMKDAGISTQAEKGTPARKFYQTAAMAASRYKLELELREVAPVSRKTGARTAPKGGKNQEQAFDAAEQAIEAAATVTKETFDSFIAKVPMATLREWASQFATADRLIAFFGYRAATGTVATEVAKPAKVKKAKAA